MPGSKGLGIEDVKMIVSTTIGEESVGGDPQVVSCCPVFVSDRCVRLYDPECFVCYASYVREDDKFQVRLVRRAFTGEAESGIKPIGMDHDCCDKVESKLQVQERELMSIKLSMIVEANTGKRNIDSGERRLDCGERYLSSLIDGDEPRDENP